MVLAPVHETQALIALLDVIVMVPIFLDCAVADAIAVVVVTVVDVVIVKRFLGLIYEAGQAAYCREVQLSPSRSHTRQRKCSSSHRGCSITNIYQQNNNNYRL